MSQLILFKWKPLSFVRVVCYAYIYARARVCECYWWAVARYNNNNNNNEKKKKKKSHPNRRQSIIIIIIAVQVAGL